MAGMQQRRSGPVGRASQAMAAVLVALLASLGLLIGAGPAQAARTVTIVINEGGTTTAVTGASAGDRIVFKNNSRTAGFAVNGIAFATGVIPPGGVSAPSKPLPVGTYDYTVQAGGLLPSGFGRVVVGAANPPAPPPSPTPPESTGPAVPPTTAPPFTTTPPAPEQPAPPDGSDTSPTPGAAVPGSGTPPTDSGGNGFAFPPRVDSGTLLPPAPGTDLGIAPTFAPDLGAPDLDAPDFSGAFPPPDFSPPDFGSPGSGFDPGQGTVGSTLGSTLGGAGPQSQALTERLNDPDTLRTFGLPSVIGIVLLAGAGSLVARVLLATTSLREWLHGRAALTRTA